MQEPRQWEMIADTISQNPFSAFDSILSELDLDKSVALEYFTLDFISALTPYADEYILKVFEMVYHTNFKKYIKLISVLNAEYDPIENYRIEETGTDTRTPDLTHKTTLDLKNTMEDTRKTETSGNNTTNTKNKLNQTHTTTDTPTNYTETNVKSVNPYDNGGFSESEKNVLTQSGMHEIKEVYSGDADTTDTTVTGKTMVENTGGTSTTNTGTNTLSETGTETTTHTLRRHGNIGVTTSQQMLEAEIILAQKMNIFKIIENDLAAKLFIQVWI